VIQIFALYCITFWNCLKCAFSFRDFFTVLFHQVYQVS
jgi:hypothetical protein